MAKNDAGGPNMSMTVALSEARSFLEFYTQLHRSPSANEIEIERPFGHLRSQQIHSHAHGQGRMAVHAL